MTQVHQNGLKNIKADVYFFQYKSVNNPSNEIQNYKNWMGTDTEPLKGFSWRLGSKRDSTGIIMWSDIFLHTIATTGEKVAIIIMDTQGLFDNETSPADNSRIFALGTLISSIQILNLVGLIQEDQLQYLQFATEFAKFALQDSQGSEEKSFQHLLFLNRDWQNPYDFMFGTEGGDEYLTEVLEIKPEQKPELKSVRELILSSFEQVQCCLLPHPGNSVVTNKDYDGQWKCLDKDFKDELAIIIEKLLGPDKLVLKKINDKDLKSFEFNEYIQTFFILFQSDTLPEVQSIYESTIDKQMSILITKCVDSYKENIVKNQDLVEEETLHIFHEMSKSKTLIMFNGEKKMGNNEHERKYKAQLEAQMDKIYVEWRHRTLLSMQKLSEEKQKTEEAVKEKFRLEQELLDAVRTTRESLKLLENQNKMKLIEDEKYEAQQKEMESRLEAEQERAKRVEAEKKADKAFRQVLEEKLKNEKLKNEKEQTKKQLDAELKSVKQKNAELQQELDGKMCSIL